MIEIFNFEQGDLEWRKIRSGIPTASNFQKIQAKGEGKTRTAYMLDLVGARITGEVPDGFSNEHTERGHEWEPEVRSLYSLMHDVEPRQVGFVRNTGICPLGPIGASPDSLIGDKGGLEIKTRLPRLQIELLLANKMPPTHMAQVQGEIAVGDLDWIDFVSYSRGMPVFTSRINRDGNYIVNMMREINQFYEEMLELEHKLRAMM